jgi:hypothetical protein
MALVVLGKTRCMICGELLMEGDDIRGLPIFPVSFGEEGRRLSDAPVHRRCCESSDICLGLLDRLADWDQ